jgi:hypothetical protein
MKKRQMPAHGFAANHEKKRRKRQMLLMLTNVTTIAILLVDKTLVIEDKCLRIICASCTEAYFCTCK